MSRQGAVEFRPINHFLRRIAADDPVRTPGVTLGLQSDFQIHEDLLLRRLGDARLRRRSVSRFLAPMPIVVAGRTTGAFASELASSA